MDKKKLDPNKSRFAKESVEKKSFQEMAQEVHDKKMTYHQKMFELGNKYVEVLKDQTLPENKGPIAVSLENEILTNLINLAIRLNNDEVEEPRAGMGSVSLLTLTLKYLVKLRDASNIKEFNQIQKIASLEARIKTLEEKLSSRTEK